jgi:2-polyprenyl-3-methyl-5-hydroxy-6-metoxy-1,4-benzoquinol methylase
MSYSYDQIPAGYYDKVFGAQDGPQSKWHHIKFARILNELGSPTSHLDFGCGPGTLVGLMPKETRVVGVDIAKPQIEYARAHYTSASKTFMKIDPGSLPFRDSSFETVSCVEVIEHLSWEDDLAVLGELKRVLRPQGKLVLTTPNYFSLWPIVEAVVNHVAKVSYENQHITKFSSPKVALLLKKAGFRDIKVRPFMFFAPFLAGIHWRLPDAFTSLEDCCSAIPVCGLSLLASARK